MNNPPKSPVTPEEAKWRASACSPEKLSKNLKGVYILLGIWIAVTLAWIIAVCVNPDDFSWWDVFILLGGYLNAIIGIVHTKRILTVKKPF